MTELEAFEAALRANPHDLAGHCAFADYLAERGDPRGAFMQVQIALAGVAALRATGLSLSADAVHNHGTPEPDQYGDSFLYQGDYE